MEALEAAFKKAREAVSSDNLPRVQSNQGEWLDCLHKRAYGALRTLVERLPPSGLHAFAEAQVNQGTTMLQALIAAARNNFQTCTEPKPSWHTQQDLKDMLERLAQHGVPMPLDALIDDTAAMDAEYDVMVAACIKKSSNKDAWRAAFARDARRVRHIEERHAASTLLQRCVYNDLFHTFCALRRVMQSMQFQPDRTLHYAEPVSLDALYRIMKEEGVAKDKVYDYYARDAAYGAGFLYVLRTRTLTDGRKRSFLQEMLLNSDESALPCMTSRMKTQIIKTAYSVRFALEELTRLIDNLFTYEGLLHCVANGNNALVDFAVTSSEHLKPELTQGQQRELINAALSSRNMHVVHRVLQFVDPRVVEPVEYAQMALFHNNCELWKHVAKAFNFHTGIMDSVTQADWPCLGFLTEAAAQRCVNAIFEQPGSEEKKMEKMKSIMATLPNPAWFSLIAYVPQHLRHELRMFAMEKDLLHSRDWHLRPRARIETMVRASAR